MSEVCDGLDNDCDGVPDDGLGTTTCGVGICEHAVESCVAGAPQGCDPFEGAVAEICGNGLDDDCDGEVDDLDACGEPTCFEGEACDTGQFGVCAPGLTSCPSGPFGAAVCVRITDPSAETCDGLDNNCDGEIDEGFDVGATCDTGDPGICGPGTLACGDAGTAVCVADSGPLPESCNDGIDQDCDGRDCVLLSIDIETPSAGLVTAEETIAVTGTVGAGVNSVAVSGVSATLVASSFNATVPLEPGPNMLVAIASDPDGNTGTDSVLVTRDTIAPNVQINSPSPGFRAIVDRVTVTGIVNDIITGGIDPRVDVNGLEAFVQQGTFMVMDVPLVRGPNPIVATAVDSVGNQASAEIQVSFDPPAGARLEPVSGNGQAGLVGTTLAEPLVVRIVDDTGNALASRVVRFEVVRSSGSIATESGQSGRVVEVPSDGAGLAQVSLTLGNRSGEGNNQVRASSVGASGEAIFCATGQPALPDKILAVMGENQKGLAGSPLPEPFEVLVVDVDGNPVAGVPVTYSVVAGGGNFDGESEKTVAVGAGGVGRALLTLGPAEGINNNIVQVTFPDNPGLPATFISTALVAGLPEDTRFAGVVLDNTNTPIPEATVHIEGSAGDVLTDAEGQFLVAGVPVGAIHLEIDPSTSPRPETFPTLAFEAATVAGRINRLPTGPIRIPPLVSDAQVVGGDEDVVLQMPGVPGLTLTVFANSATFPDGTKTGLVSINQVHFDKVPMPPPNGTLFMPPAWTVQPPGVFFDPPAPVTIPNDGLPPGRVIDIFQFDHSLNRFVNIGPGTVDEEGLIIVSDPGFGITKAGWGGGGPPPVPPTCTGKACKDKKPDDCKKVSGNTCPPGCQTSNEPDGKVCTLKKGIIFGIGKITGKCKSGNCICPVPTNWRQTAVAPRANGVLHFEYRFDSNTGNLADLSNCRVGEKVTYPGSGQFPSPPFPNLKPPNPTIRWHAATPGGLQDNHSTPGAFVKPFKNASITATQLYRYKCKCANSGNPVTLDGPISITRAVTQKADGNFKFTITKSGSSSSIDPLP